MGDSRQAGAKGKKKVGRGGKQGSDMPTKAHRCGQGGNVQGRWGGASGQTAARTSDKSAGATSDNSTVVYTGWREENMWEE